MRARASAAPAPARRPGRPLWPLLVAGATLLALAPYLAGLVGALVLRAVTGPLHARLVRRVPPRVAAIAVVLGVLVLILTPATWLAVTAAAEARDALRGFASSAALARLAHVRVADVDLGQSVASAASTLLGWTSGRAIALVGGATRATLNLCVALFGLYYLLVSGDALWTRAVRVSRVAPETARLLRARFVDVTDAMVVGTLLTAAAQGLVVGLGFAAVGLRAPVLWGVVTACVSVLPVLGSALVWLPGTAVLLLGHRYGAAAALFGLGVVAASNIDNVVRMVVYRRVSGIHPMLTLLGAFAGVRWFGLVGVLLGPLALSYALELLQVAARGEHDV